MEIIWAALYNIQMRPFVKLTLGSCPIVRAITITGTHEL